MNSTFSPFFERYSPTADLTVVAVCFVIAALMLFSYVSRGRSLRIFLAVLGSLVLAALADVSWNTIFRNRITGMYPAGYMLRALYHALLYLCFFLYSFYIAVVTGLEARRRRIAVAAAGGTAAAFSAAEFLIAASPAGFRILSDGSVRAGFNLFLAGYLVFSAGVLALLWRIRGYLYRRVMYGFFSAVAVSYGIMTVQQFFGQASCTVATFFFPVVAMLYIMHATPYNVSLGAVASEALRDTVRTLHGRGRDFGFISLYMPGVDAEGAELPERMQTAVRGFAVNYFRGARLFRIHNGHILLVYRKDRNPDSAERIRKALAAFELDYQRFRYDYKLVIGESDGEISEKNEYAGLIRSVHRNMPVNSVHRMTAADTDAYRRDLYIAEQLADIRRKHDPDDPRVLAYCQPVYNVAAGRIDTAEALLRLELEKTGLVPPDRFIPLAEETGCIHALTEIVLRKACAEVRELMREGYSFRRISVNVSALELKDSAFCADIARVIHDAGVPADRIAVELTESRNEEDFRLTREKIRDLRSRGIKLYLDDFGTGYTNLERIVTLPFDIVKFDRSLVAASGADPRAERLLGNLASTLTDMGYAILFEGVETEADEARCIGMSASFLQGNRYSCPVPVGQLKSFLQKT